MTIAANDLAQPRARTTGDARFWNEYAETMPRERLDALHLHKLTSLLDYVYERTPFYRAKLDAAGVKPGDIRSIDDFKRRIPFSDKSDFVHMQHEDPPYGPTLALPMELVAHHAETSGTTGVPLQIPYSMYDTVRYGESWVYGYWALGIRPVDSFYFAFGWGNFAGFWSAYWGARRLGCRVISGGGLDTKGHINAILEKKPTVLICTPTFALRMAAVAAEMGVDLSASSIRFTYHAGEPGPTALPAVRAAIERAYGAVAGELLGIAEIDAMAPGCPLGDGVHVNEMTVFAWAMDPTTGEEIAEGEIGELVVTSFANTAQPLLNYRTHDLVRVRRSCPCGRTWLKLEGAVLGRADFMVTVRGTNVYQTAVENLLGEMDEVSSFYELILTRENDNDAMTVRCEPVPSCGAERYDALSRSVSDRIHAALHVRLKVDVVPPGTLPRYDIKTKRIIDRRPHEFRRALDRTGGTP
ncbi:MAG: phenylacetate-CoA ligase [Candidatus Eremiobacteraeota bacterium]|nr:phenylacetate-CoA ligase [Candidatus Eremiobacteraeota bacterium]